MSQCMKFDNIKNVYTMLGILETKSIRHVQSKSKIEI